MVDTRTSATDRPGAADLGEPELLALWAIRKYADGGGARLQKVLLIACGLARIEAALDALRGLMSVLCRHQRRALRVHMMKCSRLSADERALLTLIAALQAGETDRAGALASWLVRDRADDLVEHAATLGRIFAERGYVLPAPVPVAPPRAVARRADWPRPVSVG